MNVQPSRRTFLKTALIAGCGAVMPPLAACTRDETYDIVISGGMVVDGTGSPAFFADIGVRGDRIVRIGDLGTARTALRIDARNRVVTSGFIDIHSHTDAGLLRYPGAESKVRQGVTLDVGGNCGGSPFPAHVKESRPCHPHATAARLRTS